MTGGIPLLRWAAVALAFLLLSACAAPGGPNLDVAPIATPDLMPTPEPAATPTSPAFVDATGGHAAPPFHTLAEFREMLGEAVASGSVEPFWQEIVAVGQMPLIFGENAVFTV